MRSSSVSASGSSTSIPSPRIASRSSRPAALLFAHQRAGALVDRVQLFAGGQPVGAARGHAGLDLALQPGDAHHVELVEIGRRDRDEAEPLQQRMGGIGRLLEHPLVEREPGQLPVDEALRAARRAARPAARGRSSSAVVWSRASSIVRPRTAGAFTLSPRPSRERRRFRLLRHIDRSRAERGGVEISVTHRGGKISPLRAFGAPVEMTGREPTERRDLTFLSRPAYPLRHADALSLAAREVGLGRSGARRLRPAARAARPPRRAGGGAMDEREPAARRTSSSAPPRGARSRPGRWFRRSWRAPRRSRRPRISTTPRPPACSGSRKRCPTGTPPP